MYNKYIIKFKNSRAYIKELKDNKVLYTFDINKAKLFNKDEYSKINLNNHLEIVDFNKEKFEASEERYNIFLGIISHHNDTEIDFSDLENFNNIERDLFYNELLLKYPNNKLLKELSRLINLINKADCKLQEYDYNYKSQYELAEKMFMSKYIDCNITKDIEEEEEMT